MADIRSRLIPGLKQFELLRDKLQKALGEGFCVQVETQISALYGFIHEQFDLVVFRDDEPIAAIQYKSVLEKMQLYVRTDYYTDCFKKVGIKYGILYYGDEDCYLFVKDHYGLQKFSFNGIVKVLSSDRSFGEIPSYDKVCEELRLLISKELREHLSPVQIDIFESLFTESKLSYDESRGVLSFSLESEDAFFRTLLPQKKCSVVCRYTSLNSLFLILKDKKHCMCSITCMNDKGEMNYSDSYIHKGIVAYTFSSVNQNNDCFVLSCCHEDKVDDLTMWRLYAADGKGACVEYSVDENLVDNIQFFFAPVSYGQAEHKHLELDFIRSINEWRMDGWRFEFNRWYVWKHFFKSYIFSDEEEYRLLYIPNLGSDDVEIRWIMDSTNSILSRIVLHAVENCQFPLKLRTALIGPKCPEQICNVEQFNYMNIKQNVFKVQSWDKAIRCSGIKDYR